ncbi:hypothetical protein COO91_10208 (plasmid) [Nostoc flagelliforme CCNUN1]|uniref:Uncharacterized protein n=1 Tax=Nostoc flagelliforme CCNUN1 TaxID=2038116 RepID=A0A2K8T8H1_9NOSO|nr:hypothetical protein COO91_10208 [Nostoc flagelliforme CCNUN1]
MHLAKHFLSSHCDRSKLLKLTQKNSPKSALTKTYILNHSLPASL